MHGRRKQGSRGAFVVVVLVLFAGTGSLAAKPAVKADLTSVSTDDLIARFQEVPEESIAADMVFMGEKRFVLLGGPVRIGTGLLEDPALAIMCELARRGAAAVPALLDHLSDARLTRMRLKSDEDPHPIIWRYGTEYSPRNPDLIDLPPGVNRPGAPSGDVDRSDSYRFAVGDLCYETLGEIVNRYLPASNDYASGDRSYHLINSPVHSPALAAAVRADWGSLTAEDLKQSLIEDIQRLPEDDPPVDDLQRLLFYYPDDGRALAVQLFQRSVCVFGTVGIFLYKTLVVTDNEKEQDHLLAEFREKNGEGSYRPLTQSLVLIANGTLDLSGNEEENREMTQQFENAKRIVARHFAAMNQHPRAVEITADCDSQRAIVETVKAYPSHEIDQAVRDLLKRTLALKPSDVEDKLSQCWLASACMQRLVAPALVLQL